MRASSIPMSSLPQSLQDELSSPFVKDSSINSEYSELANVVVKLVEDIFDEELIEIKGHSPLFTRNESRNHPPLFFTSCQLDINLDPNPEFEIFVAIDYSNLKEDFIDADDALRHLNAWGDYLYDKLEYFSSFAPKIKFHIYDSSNSRPFNALETYNQLYHPEKTAYEAGYVKAVTPRVIIDCGEHLNLPTVESWTQTDFPHFQILYSIVNSSTQSNREEDIINLVTKVGNGFAVVHDTQPSMKVVANILELTSVIAARFTFADKSSNLIESMLKGSITSSSKILDSKSSTLSPPNAYRELPINPRCHIVRLSSKWEKCGERSSFIDKIVDLDDYISNFNYRFNTDIYHDLKRFNSKLFEQCRELMYEWINRDLDEKQTIQKLFEEYDNINVDSFEQLGKDKKYVRINSDESERNEKLRDEKKIQIKSILESKHLDFEDGEELVRNRLDELSLGKIIHKNKDTLLNSLPELISVDDSFIGVNFTELNRADMFLLLGKLLTINEDQLEFYQSISELHNLKNHDKSLRRLNEYGINSNLVDNFTIYRHMKDYLNTILKSIDNLNDLGKQNVADMVSHFYGIKPIYEIEVREND